MTWEERPWTVTGGGTRKRKKRYGGRKRKWQDDGYGPQRKKQKMSYIQRTGGLIDRTLGFEKKFVDSFVSIKAIVATTAGAESDPTTSDCLNGLDQGTTESTRNGLQVILKSIQINGMIDMDVLSNQADGITGELVKISLVLDTQTNGSQLNSEDVWKDVVSVDVLSLRNMNFTERFTVLKVWHLEMNYRNSQTDGTNTGSLAGDAKYYGCYLKVDIPVRYTATGATVSSIMDNSLHVIAISSGTNCNNNYQCRVKFTDN